MGPAPTTRSQSRSLSRRGALPPQHTATTSAEEDAMAEEIVSEAQARLRPAFEDVDRRTQRILKRMLTVFREHQVGTHMFNGIDGYGHGDVGRDTLENVYASLFGAEAALVRVQIFSGTHAISCALFGVLRPGDKMLGLSGPPYDTLEEVIGTRVGHQEEGSGPAPGQRPLTGNLKEWGVAYDQVDLLSSVAPGQYFDIAEIDRRISADPSIRVLHIQRSCGYQWRPSIPVAEIGHVIAHIRAAFPGRELVVFVDNCYGEFVEDLEPTHVGADLVAGSLIKNPGGTLAPTGGYVIGKQYYVDAAFKRLSAPGVEGGATLGKTRWILQGLFMAPAVVGESLKGAMLLAEVMGTRFGLPCNPAPGTSRTDIIQAVQVGSRDRVIQFCQQVQRLSPIGAYIQPTAGISPGYGDEVVFAVGTFVDGSTLELSADGPLREPYTVFSQGCTHWTHWALVLEAALVRMGFCMAECNSEGKDDAETLGERVSATTVTAKVGTS
eukprot:evm.model.NODE_1045_length_14960_cov_20.819118.1